ncbi:MAG TPA: hypothetical protein VIP11_10595, partial [Gemmatimonadaceae bacterium]
EMRLVRLGPSDLKVVQVLDGLKEGDKVITLGAIMASKPETPPKLQIAADMQRGASPSRATQAGDVAPKKATNAAAKTASNSPSATSKSGKP